MFVIFCRQWRLDERVEEERIRRVTTIDRNSSNYRTEQRCSHQYKTCERNNPNYRNNYKTATLHFPLPQDNQPSTYNDNSSDYEQPIPWKERHSTPLPEPPEESSLLQSHNSDPRYFKLDPDLVQQSLLKQSKPSMEQ